MEEANYSYEEFEGIVIDYYNRFQHQGLTEVWGSICDNFDIDEEDEIYGNWFDEIIEELKT